MAFPEHQALVVILELVRADTPVLVRVVIVGRVEHLELQDIVERLALVVHRGIVEHRVQVERLDIVVSE